MGNFSVRPDFFRHIYEMAFPDGDKSAVDTAVLDQDTIGSGHLEVFRDAIYQLYGRRKANALCAERGYDLEQLNFYGRPMDGNDVIKIMLGITEVSMQDLLGLFRKIKMIDQLGISCLDIPLNQNGDMEAEIQAIADPELKRLIQVHRPLFEALRSAKSLESLDANTFQALLNFLTPIENVPEILGTKLEEGVSGSPLSGWAACSYDLDCCGMFPARDIYANDRLHLYEEVANLPGETYEERWEAYKELLVKGVANKEIPEGTIIPAPLSESGEPQFYRVEKMCASGKGMVTYLLTRATDEMQGLPPVTLFRGSAFYPSGLDAFSTVMTDLEPNLGEMAFESGKEELFEALKKTGILNGQEELLVLGHSLGGTLAERFVCEYLERRLANHLGSEPLQALSTFTLGLYNAPGVGPSKALEFKELMDRIEGFTVNGTLYKAEKDIIDLSGGPHIGYQCDRRKVPFKVVIHNAVEFSSIILAHTGRFLCRAPYLTDMTERVITEGPELEFELGNEGALPGFMEFLRITIGFIIYVLLLLPYLIIRGICGWRGVSKNSLEDMRELQMQLTDDMEQLSNLLKGDFSSETVIQNGKSWIRSKIDSYLDRYLGDMTHPVRKAQARREILTGMREMSSEDLINLVLFRDSDVRLKKGLSEDFPVLASASLKALMEALGEPEEEAVVI